MNRNGGAAGTQREFAAWLSGRTLNRWPHLTERRTALLAALPSLLAYEHLSCWCSLDHPCHVDVLIERLREIV